MARFVIPPEKLRWQIDSRSIKPDSTSDAKPVPGTIGAEVAREALAYAIDFPGSGQHVFVRGRPGSRRRILIDRVIEDLNPEPRQARDFCYVHNFSNPDRPRLIRLKSGQGRQFQQHMLRIGLFVKERLPEILENDPIRSRRESRKVAAEREVRQLLKPFEKQIEKDGLGLIRSQSGPSARLELGIKVMGKPVSLEEFRNMVARQQASEDERRSINEKVERFQPELQKISRQIREIWQQTQQHVEQINVSEAARILGEMSAEVTRQFKAPGVESFLRDVIDDVLEKRVGHDTRHLADPSVLYSVKVLKSDAGREQAPVIAPNLISAGNLFGSVDPAWRSGERAVASFRGIHAGALIEADGGFLILDAEELIHQPELFRRLIRTLRGEAAEIIAPTPDWSHAAQSLKPEPVPVDCCVIVFGDHDAYRTLAALDKEFTEQFRILAELEDTVPRNEQGLDAICSLLAAIVEEQSLLPLDRSALAAVIEYLARDAVRPDELSVNPGQLAALAREATFLAGEQDRDEVSRGEIEQAIQRQRRRASVAWHGYLRRMHEGPDAVQTRGKQSGRIAITSTLLEAGQAFALPASIAFSVAPAITPGAGLSGPDGRGGRFEQPLDALARRVAAALRIESALDIRLVQSLGQAPTPEDLEAAMLALTCGTVATLAGSPLRQDLLLLGSLNPRLQVGPVSRVNERIEAFHDACAAIGLSGQQAVAVPKTNTGQLMLDARIIKACTNDTFRVQAIDTFVRALELVTGESAGSWVDGEFTPDSVLARARAAVQAAAG